MESGKQTPVDEHESTIDSGPVPNWESINRPLSFPGDITKAALTCAQRFGAGHMKSFDVWRTVDLLTSTFGSDAELIASQLADAWESEGDATMNLIWNRVSQSIRDLQRLDRGQGESVH